MKKFLRTRLIISLIASHLVAALGFYYFFTTGDNTLLKIAIASFIANVGFYFLFVHNKNKKVERESV